MELLFDGAGPMYAQLTRALKLAIHRGQLRAGERLDSSRALAEDLGISRNTVKAAFEQLSAEGYITTVAGSGSYVRTAAQKGSTAAGANAELPAQSEYARRTRTLTNFRLGAKHAGLRYNLQYGSPIHDLLAIDTWRRELTHAARRTPLEYPPQAGVMVLRSAVADYLRRRRGIQCVAEDVLIVSGTQQALSIAARALVDEADTVVLEDPQYFAAFNVFEAHGCKLRTVPIDAEGLSVAALPAAPSEPAPKLIVVTPAHQFPVGTLMSVQRRMELLRYAQRHNSWIFEDDYDSEFRFGTSPVPALMALDEHSRVIYSGTFSKTLFPSLRLGYMVLPRSIRTDLLRTKVLMDKGNPSIEQMAMARYLSSGRFEKHLRRVVLIAKERRAALLRGLQKYGQSRLVVDDSSAGMHLVAWMPKTTHAQCVRFTEYAAQRGLGLHPVMPHFRAPPAMAGLLLGYAGMSATEIEAAMKILGACLKAAIASGILRKTI